MDRGDVDPGPAELGEPVGLHGVGVGERERVTAAAVEGPGQVQHPGAEPGVPAVGLVPAALPVEGALERVLDGQRAALDEEQVRQLGIAEHPLERRHELGQLHGVEVGVRRLVRRHPAERLQELRVVGEGVHAERRRREKRVEVQISPAVPGVDQPGTRAPVQIEHQPVTVDQQMP